MKQTWPWVLLAGLMLVAYVPALTGERVWDDHLLLEGNPVITGTQPWTTAFDQPFLPFDAYYRPLTALTLRSLLWLGQGATWPFHLVSWLLHLGITAFVFRLSRWTGLRRGPALAAAALFGLHPAMTEAVVWISGLGDVLAAGAMAAATICWLRFLGEIGRRPPRVDAGAFDARTIPAPKNGDRGFSQAILWSVASAFLLGAACLAKETALPLALAFVASLWLIDQRWASDRLASPRPHLSAHERRRYLVIALSPLITVLVLYAGMRASALNVSLFKLFAAAAGSVPSAITDVAALHSPWLRLALLGRYAVLAIAPFRLSIAHGVRIAHGLGDAWVWCGLLTILLIGLAVARSLRTRPRELFGLAWFGLTLAPALLFTPPQTALFSERYLYIPAVGLMVVLAAGAQSLLEAGPRFRRPAARILLAVVLLAALVLTTRRAFEWRREESLLDLTLRREPNASAAAVNLGLLWRQAGRTDDAVALFQRTLHRFDTERDVLWTDVDRTALGRMAYEAGIMLARRGQLEQAEESMRSALRFDPQDERALGTMGAILGERGRYAEACDVLNRGIRLHPASVLLHQNLALCLYKTGNRDRAADEYRTVLRLHPGDPGATEALSEMNRAPQKE